MGSLKQKERFEKRLDALEELLCQSFDFLLELGFKITTKQKTVHQDQAKLCIFYLSKKREFQVRYHLRLDLSQEPKEFLVEKTSIQILSVDKVGSEKYFDLNGYLLFKEPNKPHLLLFEQHHQNGQDLRDYQVELRALKAYLTEHLLGVIQGDRWILAYWTRLDGFKIQDKKGTEFFE